jgi:hydrogenase-4 component B
LQLTRLLLNLHLAIPVAMPLLALLGWRYPRFRRLGPILLLVSTLVGIITTVLSWRTGQSPVIDLSRILPFPFVLTLDRLSSLFLFLVSAVSAATTLFSIPYVERHYSAGRQAWIWTFLPLFILSMVLVVTAASAFAFLFGWELMTVFSAALVAVDGDSPERRHNLLIYLLMMHAGAAAVAASFFLYLPSAHGLTFAEIRTAGANLPGHSAIAIYLLALLGFSTKAGVIPVHLWLPRTHPIAPSPVSALMSAVMLKTAVYGLVRFGFDFLPHPAAWWGYLVLLAGMVSSVLGILYALGERDIKRLLAYSSVENIGIIYLGLGAALIFRAYEAPVWASLALVAALGHTVNHALFKSLLFMGAGSVSAATHTLNLDELGGLLSRMPYTGTSLLVACCSIAGLPLFNGFISEWLTFRSFLAGATLPSTLAQIVLPLSAGGLALVGGLSAACFMGLFGTAFLGRPRSVEAKCAVEAPWAMHFATGVLALACASVGVYPALLLRPLSLVANGLIPYANAPQELSVLPRLLPILSLCVLGAVLIALAIPRVIRVTAIWACGLPQISPRMEYTATAFSKPLRSVFATVYKANRKIEVLPADQPYFPVTVSYRSVRTTSFERSLYRPAVDAIVAAANQIRRLHTGNVQMYLLYIFLTLVSLLVVLKALR